MSVKRCPRALPPVQSWSAVIATRLHGPLVKHTFVRLIVLRIYT